MKQDNYSSSSQCPIASADRVNFSVLVLWPLALYHLNVCDSSGKTPSNFLSCYFKRAKLYREGVKFRFLAQPPIDNELYNDRVRWLSVLLVK